MVFDPLDEIVSLASELPFQRGDARTLFRRLTPLNEGLTLALVPRERRAEAVRLKNLYSLWNIVVDDEIDRLGTQSGVDASMDWLLARRRRRAPEPRASIVRLLEQIVGALAGADQSRLELVEIDLMEIAFGFVYEAALQRMPWAATPQEYEHNSTATISIKLFLDIDLAFAASPIEMPMYRALRETYEELGFALKLASDIGSLRRELLDEGSSNSIMIRATSAGILDPTLRPSRADYPAIRGALDPLITETRSRVFEHLERARSAAARSTVSLESVLGTASNIVSAYADQQLDFFPDPVH